MRRFSRTGFTVLGLLMAVAPVLAAGDALQQGQRELAAGQWDRAIEFFTTALKENPKSDQALVSRGWAWHEKREFNRCIDDCTAALEINPKNMQAHLNRGAAYYDKDPCYFADALADYQAAVKLYPQNLWAYNNMAWVLATHPVAGVRNGKKAVEYAEKASGLGGSNSTSVMDTLAAALAESGRFDEAVKWQKKALSSLVATPGVERREFEQRLKLYERGQPYHRGS